MLINNETGSLSMKNLSIKKVALGLLLAGYAASSAFALQTASSGKTIIGNAPILAKKDGTLADTASQGKITITAGTSNFKAGEVTKVGDVVIFEFATVDADGDTATATKGSAKNLVVYYGRTVNGAMVWTAATTGYVVDSANKVTFTLGSDSNKAEKIGFKIQAETEFGAPDKGLWISGNSLSGSKPPLVGPDDPSVNPGGDGESGGGDGEGVVGPDNPIVSQSAKLGIFLVNTAGTVDYTANYANSAATVVPKLGDTFEMVYWDDTNGDNEFTTGEETYTVISPQWSLTGNNTAAQGNTTATDLVLADANTVRIVLPATNAAAVTRWSNIPTAQAGIQGFTLTATSTNE